MHWLIDYWMGGYALYKPIGPSKYFQPSNQNTRKVIWFRYKVQDCNSYYEHHYKCTQLLPLSLSFPITVVVYATVIYVVLLSCYSTVFT